MRWSNLTSSVKRSEFDLFITLENAVVTAIPATDSIRARIDDGANGSANDNADYNSFAIGQSPATKPDVQTGTIDKKTTNITQTTLKDKGAYPIMKSNVVERRNAFNC